MPEERRDLSSFEQLQLVAQAFDRLGLKHDVFSLTADACGLKGGITLDGSHDESLHKLALAKALGIFDGAFSETDLPADVDLVDIEGLEELPYDWTVRLGIA